MQIPNSRQSKIGVFILTCRKSPKARLKSAQAGAQRSFPGFSITVIDGIIAEDSDVDRLIDPKAARRWSKRFPTRAEIATYGTHRIAWREMLDHGFDAAVILEDDFEVVDDGALNAVIAALPEIHGSRMDILKLFDFHSRRKNNPAIVRNLGDLPIVKWHSPHAGMVGYVISADGARKFLKRRQIFRVVDEDIKFYWELGLDVWSTKRHPLIDASNRLGGSLLEPARLSERQRRSLGRSLHGLAITAHRKFRNRIAFRSAVRKHAAVAERQRDQA
jgi:glycosyl transferase, family 25